MKILFMGTPQISVPTLDALFQNNMDVAGIVTQPDRPSGRRMIITPSPVKETGLKNRIKIYQPQTVREPEFIEEIKKLEPELIVIVAFGQILPESFLSIPSYGTINMHASLLPKYRGASPINKAIISGDEVTGVTTMYVEKQMDAGDILLQEEVKIMQDDTVDTLAVRIGTAGADLIVKTIRGIIKGNIYPVPQDHSKATYTGILKKEDGHINWSDKSYNLRNFVRGMNSWPGAFSFHNGIRWKIFKIETENIEHSNKPGVIIKVGPDRIYVSSGDGAVSFNELQAENSKRLSVTDFLKGHSVKEGDLLQ